MFVASAGASDIYLDPAASLSPDDSKDDAIPDESPAPVSEETSQPPPIVLDAPIGMYLARISHICVDIPNHSLLQ